MSRVEDWMEQDKKALRKLKRRADKARDFPTGTDPCSRHAYIIADRMAKKGGYPMLSEEPSHCAISIMGTVAALWEERAVNALLKEMLNPQPGISPSMKEEP